MKALKFIFVSVMLAFAITATAQNEKTVKKIDVPEHIANKFSNDHPQSPNAKWSMDGENYVVEFATADGVNKKLWYNKAGEIHSEELTLKSENDLPSRLRDIMSGKYAGYKVNRIVEVKNVGITSYRLRIEKDGEFKDILLDA